MKGISKRELYDLMDKVRQVKKYYAELDEYVANCLSDCMDQLCDAVDRIDELNNEL